MTFVPPNRKPDDDREDALSQALGGLAGRFANAVKTRPDGVGDLLRHAQRGDVAAVKAQLAAGVCPKATGTDGRSALHLAARANHAEVIKVLVAAGADLRQAVAGEKNSTPLHDAVNFGCEAAAEALLQAGAYAPDVPGAPTTFLHRAAEKGKTRLIKALIEAGADPLLVNGVGTTAFATALAAKQSAAVCVMLQMPQVAANINVPLSHDEDGMTPFHVAVLRGDVSAVAAMLDAGAFLHQPTTRDGMTPLLLAIRRGEPDIVYLLLSRGADPDRPMVGPPPGWQQLQPTPLMFLCRQRTMNEQARADITRDLLAAGADPHALDPQTGELPLHQLLSSHNIYSAMKVLIAGGAPIGRRNRRGATPLMLAVERASMHEMTNLLAAGADPNARHGQDGRTALMIAAAAGQSERMVELLQAGADPRATDNHGKSVMDYVADNRTMASLTRPVLEVALAKPVKPPLPKGPGRG